MAQAWNDTYYRMTHVTGPGCVLVSLRFGTPPPAGPYITFRAAREAMVDPMMNVDAYVAEVHEGVKEANEAHQSKVRVLEVEIVPDDHPTKGQVRHCARTLAENYITAPNQAVHAIAHPRLSMTADVRSETDEYTIEDHPLHGLLCLCRMRFDDLSPRGYAYS